MLPLGLLTAAQGHPMLVELKNGETLNGHLVNCDTYMNLTLKEVVQTSPEGDKFFRLPECYVRGNNIKYLRVPDEIVDVVKEQQATQQAQRGGRGGGMSGRGDHGGRGDRGRGMGRGRLQGQEQRTTSDIIYLTEATEATHFCNMSPTDDEIERDISGPFPLSSNSPFLKPSGFDVLIPLRCPFQSTQPSRPSLDPDFRTRSDPFKLERVFAVDSPAADHLLLAKQRPFDP
ncbi:hypothetical protein KC356_g5995 [Hortaea werneckii]|nr:hypothetical protein KC356_g5995 [Hortaea werneckii]